MSQVRHGVNRLTTPSTWWLTVTFWIWHVREYHAKIRDGVTLPLKWWEDPMRVDVVRVVRTARPDLSKGEIKRLIREGAIELDCQPVGDVLLPYRVKRWGELVWIEHGSQLRVGKKTLVFLKLPFWTFFWWGYPIR